jgi:hypothetical protein
LTATCVGSNPASPANFTFIVFPISTKYAGVAEWADAPELGSGALKLEVQLLSLVPLITSCENDSNLV